jgi:hypothetical protein
MVKGRALKSAIDAAVSNLNRGADVAQEVMDSAGKNLRKSTIIKNAVNNVASNRTAGQTKVLNNAGEQAVKNVINETKDTAKNVTLSRTAERAVANAKSKMDLNSYVVNKSQQRQDISDIVNRIKNNKSVEDISGVHAQQRSTAMDTIVNNVKDSNINRTVGSNNTLNRRNAINQAIDNVNNNRAAKNVIDSSNNTTNQMPINRQVFNTEPQASPAIRNNITGDMGGTKAKTNQSGPRVEEPKFQGNTAQEGAVEPQFDFGGAQPDKVDPLDNQTRPTLGEGVDWKSMGGKAKEFFTGGFTDTYNAYKANGGDFTAAVKSAYQNEDGSLRMGRIAGSYMAAAAGVRVLSGGGVTKDRNGNNNLIGVPFI